MTMPVAPRRAEAEDDIFDDRPTEPVVDHGELSPSTRRVLLQLIRGPYLRAQAKPNLWSALIRDEAVVRSRLADLYLDLVVDTDAQVAFVRNLELEDAPRVVRSNPLTVLDTVLVLFLRRKLLASQSTELRCIVGRDEIEDQLRSYRRAETTDQTGFDKRIAASVNKMRDYAVLLTTEDDDRWEISPVLALIFGADEVAVVTEELTRLAQEGS